MTESVQLKNNFSIKLTPMQIKPFTIVEKFWCKWEYGAKEYFDTLEEAIEKARSYYVKKASMSEENFQYWSKQNFTVGKELVITQELQEISNI